MIEPSVRLAVLPENIIPVCDRCRGSGVAGTPRTDKRDHPPIELCRACGGSGTKPTDHAEYP